MKKKMAAQSSENSTHPGAKDLRKKAEDKLNSRSKKIKKTNDLRTNTKSPSPKKLPGEEDIYLENNDAINPKLEDKQSVTNSENMPND